MTTDFRALCAELHAAFTTYAVDECHHNLLERTRAALADGPSSVVSEPSDEEIMELWHGSDWYNEGATLREFISIARAVLARWGNPESAPNPWKDTLLDALVCNFLLNAENEDDPRKALNDLIAWEKQLATDPLINPARNNDIPPP